MNLCASVGLRKLTVWAPRFFAHDAGGDVQDKRDTLVAACQLMGLSLAGLLVPGALIVLVFDTVAIASHHATIRPKRSRSFSWQTIERPALSACSLVAAK